jgi:hypothetical protein
MYIRQDLGNDIELTSRDLVGVQRWTEAAARKPDRRQKSAEGRKLGKEEPQSESPNGIRKDLKAGKIRTQSHD